MSPNTPVVIDLLSKVESRDDLLNVLKHVRLAAGQPSLRTIEQSAFKMGVSLSRATLQDILSGKRAPKWWATKTFAVVVGGVPDRPEIQDDQNDDLRPWIDAWTRAEAAASGTPEAGVKSLTVGAVPTAQQLVSPSDFFVARDDLDEIQDMILNAQDEVWLWGTTLSMHIPYLESYLERALAKDVQVKILLIPSGSNSMAMSAFRAGPHVSQSRLESRLNANFEILADLSSRTAGMEVRLVDYLAPYTLYAYDPNLPHGLMDLRLGSFYGKHEYRPTFRITREQDSEWFDYFAGQFASVWNAADTYLPRLPEGKAR